MKLSFKQYLIEQIESLHSKQPFTLYCIEVNPAKNINKDNDKEKECTDDKKFVDFIYKHVASN